MNRIIDNLKLGTSVGVSMSGNNSIVSPRLPWFLKRLFSALLLCIFMVLPAQVGGQQLPIFCLGRIQPGDRIISVSAMPSSLIQELRVSRGDSVQEGQVLAVLRNYRLALAALSQAEAEAEIVSYKLALTKAGEKTETLESQRAIVEQQLALLKKAESDFERHKALTSKKVLSQSDFDETTANLNAQKELYQSQLQRLMSLKRIRTEDVSMVESELLAAKAAVECAKAEVELQLIRSPMQGEVLEIYAYPGELVGEQGLLALGAVEDMQVEAEVYLSDVPRLRLGVEAVVTGEAFQERLQGRVFEIGRYSGTGSIFPVSPTESVDKRIVKVRIRLEQPEKVRSLSNSQVEVVIQP
jgi:HlyD family secretion protein